MPKVTESLRRQWANQRKQALEEREFTQSGKRRSAEDVAIVDFDVAVMDALLALPVGTKFDARDVQKQVAAQREES